MISTIQAKVSRLLPQFQEGPHHYAMRAAEACGTTVHHLHGATFGFGLESVPLLQSDSLKPVRNMVAAIQSHQEQSSSSWIRDRGRVCPKCIAENTGAGSVGWELRFADACGVHGTWLQQNCECGASINLVRGSLRHCCVCGRKLSSLAAIEAPAAVVRLSRLLIEKVCEPPAPSIKRIRALSGHAQPEDLNLADLQNLVAVLGLYGDPKAPLRRTGARRINDATESWQVTSLAAEALSNWPIGFRQLLDWLRTQNDDGTSHRLGHRFGRLYRCLYQIVGASQFGFLHNEIEQYLRDHWPAALWRGKGRINGATTPTRWLLASETRSRLGISQATLDDLIARGVLIGDRRTTATGRTRLMIQRDSVAVFEASGDNNSVNLTVAAHVLGLGEMRLRECIQDLVPRAWKATGGVWRVPRGDLEELLSVGLDRERILGIDTQDVVTLSASLRFSLLTTEGLIWLVDEIRSGREFLLGKMDGLRGIASWIVGRGAIDRAKDALRARTASADSLFTLPDLARRWKVKQEVVYALHRCGALQSQSQDDACYRGKLIPLTEAKRFESSFVSARKLAGYAQQSPRRLIKHLYSNGIRASFGGEGTPCRQHIYRVEEALIEALRGLKTGGIEQWNASASDGL